MLSGQRRNGSGLQRGPRTGRAVAVAAVLLGSLCMVLGFLNPEKVMVGSYDNGRAGGLVLEAD